MMPNPPLDNRALFWRIVRRMLGANRSRLLVLLLALGTGAAIIAALLNLQVDAKRRLTTEFRAFGPNVIVAPRRTTQASVPLTVSESIAGTIPRELGGQAVSVNAVLYLVGEAYKAGKSHHPVVIAGASANVGSCTVGARAASEVGLKPEDNFVLRAQGRETSCSVDRIQTTGGPEDNEVTISLQAAQQLTGLSGQVSVMEISAVGTPAAIETYIANLQKQLPDVDVRPIRQFTEAEGKIYNRIGGLLTATVVLVLVLTALCVMAGMTNAAMERKNDVGLMKAIGGATRRVMRIFLAEAAVLGLIGGLFGAAAGIALSIWLGQAVFGVAARPRLIVYPISVVLTIIVAIAGALPLRRLAEIRPASVFRGEA
jgi:putative ABC transport system permease protein